MQQKGRIIIEEIKIHINVRPKLNGKLMAANIYVISLMSKSFV